MATYKTSKQTNRKSRRSNRGTKMVNSSTSNRRNQSANIGGNVINKTTQRSKYLIYSRLDASGNEVNTNTTSTGAAIELLLATGCIVSQGALSFLTDTDDTMIKNPNIEDEIRKQGAPISATDKFIDVEGSFYNLDPAMSRPEAKALQEQKAKDANNYVRFAADMVQMMGQQEAKKNGFCRYWNRGRL